MNIKHFLLSNLILLSSISMLEANIIDKLKGRSIDLYEPSVLDKFKENKEEKLSYTEYRKKYFVENKNYDLYIENDYEITSGPIPKFIFKEKIKEFHDKMKDVKYVFGGASMDGIDCSAFIRKFYNDEFNVKLTRSTHTQVYEGIPIDRNELQLGDLIFFKEKNRVSNHVGIYIGNGKMLHSSSGRKGIGIDYVSKFDHIYWTSRRVLDIRS